MTAGEASLKLAAFDTDDLQILSAHMQDAVLTVGQIRYLPQRQKLALVANRFDWEIAESGEEGSYRRCLTGLQFARVRSARCRKIRQENKDAVLVLMSIGFEPGELPAGAIVLTFAGGGELRLEVECIEALLQDLGPGWKTGCKPVHDMSEAS
jgi:hypothetical protein